MLKKLIKYDLKDLFSISWIFYIILLSLSLISYIFNEYDLYKKNILLDLIHGILELILIIMLIIFLGFVIFKILSRFSNNTYSDEGYLTNTLPVSQIKLYFSKILSAIIYILTSSIIAIIAYSIGLTYIFTKHNGTYVSTLQGLIEEYSGFLKLSQANVLAILIILIFLEIMVIVLSGYNGIIKNHLTNNPKKIKSIIYSIGYYLLSVLIIVLTLYISSKINPDISKVFSLNSHNFYKYIYNYTSACRQIACIGIFSYLTIDILLLLNGYRLFNKGINLE